MNFFEGHNFSIYGSYPEHTGESHHVPIYYGLQYNHAGHFWLDINHSGRIEYNGPHAFITHPGAFFEYGNVDGETRHHTFICSYGDRITRYIDSGLMKLETHTAAVPICHPERFLNSMTQLMSLLRNNLPIVPPRAVLLYEELLLQMSEQPSTDRQFGFYHRDYFNELIETIRKKPQQNWDFAKEAHHRNLTEAHFRRLFKAFSGLPPRQFLIQSRLQHAAMLLITTREPVGTIAGMAGIENEFYFSRLFKEKFQVSPLEYRREFVHQ